MEAFEIEQRLGVGVAGGIALVIGDDVGTVGLADFRRLAQRFVEQLAKLHRMHFRIAELLRQMIGDRVVEFAMIENGRIEEAGENRFAGGHVLGFAAHALPDGIANGKRLVPLDGLRHGSTPRQLDVEPRVLPRDRPSHGEMPAYRSMPAVSASLTHGRHLSEFNSGTRFSGLPC